MMFSEWWAKRWKFGFGARWLEPLCIPMASAAWEESAAQQAAEIQRLRAALAGLLEYPSGQYSEGDGYDKACESAQAALTPNVEVEAPLTAPER